MKSRNSNTTLKKAMKKAARNLKAGRFSLAGGALPLVGLYGFTGANSASGVPGTVSNDLAWTAGSGCTAVRPPYFISPPYPPAGTTAGLPGMSGGRMRRQCRRTMKGGRYGFDAAAIQGVTPNAAAWWAGTYAPIHRIACEGSTPNPLNPGPHTPSTQPLPVASATGQVTLPLQSGGTALRPADYATLGGDTVGYYAPTAGYANQPSSWVDSVGAPVQLQIPYAARAMNPACLKTGGGGKRKTKKQNRKNRKNRKDRKH